LSDRIYGEKVNIDENKAKSFWNKRAVKYDDANPYVTVKLGDKNPERAKQWDEYEKTKILPLLNIDSNDNVLDIGCGIGRLSDLIIPKYKYYLGTDYAEDLISIANKRIIYHNKNYAFKTIAAQNISCDNKDIIIANGVRYTIVILAGVFPYMNDENIQICLCNIMNLMASTSKLYIANAIHINQRLTLDNYYSEDLEANYHIIYRTQDEYMKLFAPLFDNGFKLIHNGDFEIETANNNETKRSFCIFSRNEK